MEIHSDSHRIHFQKFVLDRSQHKLLCDGREIPLRPKTLAVLEYLVLHRDRIVPKEELLAQVWPGLQIETQGVFQSISELRTALGRHDFIETIRGTGYRWAAPSRETTHVCNSVTKEYRPKRKYWGIFAATACGLMLAVLPAIWNSLERWGSGVVDARSDDIILERARDHLSGGELESAEYWLDTLLSRRPDHLEARLDLAYLREAQGQVESANQIAMQTYSDAVVAGAQHLRMASAAMLSRSALIDSQSAEYFAQEAITMGNRLRSPEFAAMGHERLGALLLDRGEPALAVTQWKKAIEHYSGSCPAARKRVQNLLAVATRGE